MKTINFGIDLGTTNSLIAQYKNGKVEIYKNPVGFKETLPSCVAYRSEKILVGDKAREWIVKDPLNVFSSFKRKMGTGEKFFIHSKSETISPVSLSAQVLKELKNFIPQAHKPASVVITIPASFDTVQSNATRQAGIEAGFEEVVLLQEPIAASLAFFNSEKNNIPSKGKWLVYDLGGGTFDTALVQIENGEMKVIDHQGDNFLGGVDFDHLIVAEILTQKIEQAFPGKGWRSNILSKAGLYEKLYYTLLFKAEEAKKELSVADSTEVEMTLPLDDGSSEDLYFDIYRSEFNHVITEKILGTLEMVQEVMSRNNESPSSLDSIIMIGGSTLIPLVRELLQEKTGIRLDHSADPTNAVAMGAAYYAGTKVSFLKEAPEENKEKEETGMQVQLAFSTTTQDLEEYITASIQELKEARYYRITREDGGYDSGIKPLALKVGEFVGIRAQVANVFHFKMYTAAQEEIPTRLEPIVIQHGLFSLYGQPLPEDICIEVDDPENNSTKSELIFARNSILPLKKTLYKEVSRTIKKGSNDSLIIHIQEGDHLTHPNANKAIGFIEIKSQALNADLVKGSEVEIVLEITESRDISVAATLLLTMQEFKQVFSPTEKYVHVDKLKEEVTVLKNELEQNLLQAEGKEEFETAAYLKLEMDKVLAIETLINSMPANDSSDLKYQLDERKRKIARDYYTSNSANSKLNQTMEELVHYKNLLQDWTSHYDDIPQNLKDEHIVLKEKEILVIKSQSYYTLKAHISAQSRLLDKMIMNTPTLLTLYFHIYASLPENRYTNVKEAHSIIQKGEKALERQNYEELRGLFTMLLGITRSFRSEQIIKGTGLGG